MKGDFAYIDNQNLYMATHCAPEPWDVDMKRFRVYLREKYNVANACLFMGTYNYGYQDMYSETLRAPAGHASITTTMGIYAHANLDDKRAAAALVDW